MSTKLAAARENAAAERHSASSNAAIRMARADDAAALAAIYEPHVTTSSTSFELVAPTPAEMAERVCTTLELTPWLVYERGAQVLGFAYANKHRERAAYQWSLDASVYVDASCQRQGIGRALYTSLFELAKLLGYYAVHAGITLPHPSSVGLHEAVGFRLVGVFSSVGHKLGAWRDVGWWQLELRERRSVPAPPRTLPELLRADPEGVAAALRLKPSTDLGTPVGGH